MIRIIVVFPAPFRPSNANVCPSGIFSETSRNTWCEPNDFASLSTQITDLFIGSLRFVLFGDLVFCLGQSRTEHAAQLGSADSQQQAPPDDRRKLADKLFVFLIQFTGSFLLRGRWQDERSLA